MNPLLVACVALIPCFASAQEFSQRSQNRPTVLVVVPPQPTLQSKQLVNAFAKDPALANVKSRFKVQTLKTSDVLYQERYAKALPEFEAPIVAVCDPLARVFYKASRTTLPSSSERLATTIVNSLATPINAAQSIDEFTDGCPDGNCPNQPYCPDGNCPTDPSSVPLPDSPTVGLGVGEWIAIAVAAVVALAIVALLTLFVLLLLKYLLVRK